MSTDDPRVPLLDEALMTLDTYRARSPRMRSATATWRSSDAARIIAALPAVGLALVTKGALDRAEAVVEAARAVLIPEPDADYLPDEELDDDLLTLRLPWLAQRARGKRAGDCRGAFKGSTTSATQSALSRDVPAPLGGPRTAGWRVDCWRKGE